MLLSFMRLFTTPLGGLSPHNQKELIKR